MRLLSRLLALVLLALAPSLALAQGQAAPIRLPRGSTGPADTLTLTPGVSALGFDPIPLRSAAPRYTVYATAYGAKCDGTTDDTAALRAAIAAAQNLAGVLLTRYGYTLSTYHRGGATLALPAGVCRVTGTLLVNSGRVEIAGEGSNLTTIWSDGDYGDTLRIVDPHLSQNTGGNGVRGLSFWTGTEKTSGAHLYLQYTSFSYYDDLNFQSGFEGLVIDGGYENDYTRLRAKSTASFMGAPKTGSTFIRLAQTSGQYTNSNLRFRGVTTASDENVRVVENAIVIESADIVYFKDGEIAGVADTEILVRPTGSSSVQGVRISDFNFDNYAKYGFRCTGTLSGNGSGVVQNLDLDGDFFIHDINHVLIDCPKLASMRMRVKGLDAGQEGIAITRAADEALIVVDGPVLRSVGSSSTADRQYSGIKIAKGLTQVNNAFIRRKDPYSLKYGVEIADGLSGVIVTGATGVIGANAFGLVRNNGNSQYNAIVGVPALSADGAPGIGTQ